MRLVSKRLEDWSEHEDLPALTLHGELVERGLRGWPFFRVAQCCSATWGPQAKEAEIDLSPRARSSFSQAIRHGVGQSADTQEAPRSLPAQDATVPCFRCRMARRQNQSPNDISEQVHFYHNWTCPLFSHFSTDK